ncbi:MAG: polysaccharide deacetylase family protein [Ekhidna sp.]
MLKAGALIQMESKVAISVDVEDWYHSRHVLSTDNAPNSAVKAFKQKFNRNFTFLNAPIQKLLELYDRFNVRATFFLVADLIDDYQNTFESIVDAGHEIGCHGLHHIEYIGEGSAAELQLFRENVSMSKRMLEELCGSPVIGFRAPSAFYRPWMTVVLKQLGFTYDSSISRNSLFNKFGRKIPNHIQTSPVYLENSGNNQSDIVEIPWPYLNIAGFKIPTGGGPTIRYFPPFINKWGVRQSLRKGDTSLYIHPHDISLDPLPDIIADSRRKFWRNRGEEAHSRYRSIIESFEGRTATCGEIYERFLRANQGV